MEAEVNASEQLVGSGTTPTRGRCSFALQNPWFTGTVCEYLFSIYSERLVCTFMVSICWAWWLTRVSIHLWSLLLAQTTRSFHVWWWWEPLGLGNQQAQMWRGTWLRGLATVVALHLMYIHRTCRTWWLLYSSSTPLSELSWFFLTRVILVWKVERWWWWWY